MVFIVYALLNQDSGKKYIGYTRDLEKRLKRHNNQLPHKKSSYTYKQKGLWKLVYSEEYNTMQEARLREKQLKSAQGREFLKQFFIRL